jgi:hypothetical protein
LVGAIAFVACGGGTQAEPSTHDEESPATSSVAFMAWFLAHVDDLNAARQHALSAQDALADFDFGEAQRFAQLSSDAYGALHDGASANDDGSELARAVTAGTHICRDAWNSVALSLDLVNESQFDLAQAQIKSCVEGVQKIQDAVVAGDDQSGRSG